MKKFIIDLLVAALFMGIAEVVYRKIYHVTYDPVWYMQLLGTGFLLAGGGLYWKKMCKYLK